MKDIDGSVVLAIRFYCDDLGKEVSIGEYLIELLTSLWSEGRALAASAHLATLAGRTICDAPLSVLA